MRTVIMMGMLLATMFGAAACTAQPDDGAGEQGAAMSSSSQEDVERVQVLCTDFQDRYLWRMIQHENGACDAQRIDTYNGVGTTPKHFSRCPSKNACVAALQTAADGS